MSGNFGERFAGDVNVEKRYPKAREIGDVVLRSSQLTDEFSNKGRIPRLADSRRENDVEHSYMLAIAAPAVAEQFYPDLFDVDKVRRFSLYHDLIEIETGDVATFNLSKAELAEKDRREQEAKKVVRERLSQISPNMADDFDEYEEQKVIEAKFVRMMDKLLPVATDITGDGLRVIREDFGVTSLDELVASHDELFDRMQEKFGKDFPDLVAAHAILAVDFEKKYEKTPNEQLKVKEVLRGPVETELKFLVDELPSDLNLENVPHTVLRQGYVVVNSDGAETRIRSFDNERFELTVKSGDMVQRSEQTVKLPREMFEVMWHQTAGRRVEKTRYNIPYGKYTIELDIYEGHLTGLITAEVEFTGRPEEADVKASVFEPPVWFGRDVSKDRRFKNQNLAHGVPREPLNLGAKQL